LGDDDAAKLTTTTWFTTSDSRTKKNVRPYTPGLEFIQILPDPIRFEYNGEFGTVDGIEGIGFIGNDLHSLGTSLTKVDDRGVVTFTPHELFFVYVNAFKEVSKKMDATDEAIVALKKQVSKLKLSLSKIEDECCDDDDDD